MYAGTDWDSVIESWKQDGVQITETPKETETVKGMFCWTRKLNVGYVIDLDVTNACTCRWTLLLLIIPICMLLYAHSLAIYVSFIICISCSLYVP